MRSCLHCGNWTLCSRNVFFFFCFFRIKKWPNCTVFVLNVKVVYSHRLVPKAVLWKHRLLTRSSTCSSHIPERGRATSALPVLTCAPGSYSEEAWRQWWNIVKGYGAQRLAAVSSEKHGNEPNPQEVLQVIPLEGSCLQCFYTIIKIWLFTRLITNKACGPWPPRGSKTAKLFPVYRLSANLFGISQHLSSKMKVVPAFWANSVAPHLVVLHYSLSSPGKTQKKWWTASRTVDSLPVSFWLDTPV